MAHLTKGRLCLHGIIVLLSFIYIFWYQTSWAQTLPALFFVIAFDLVYLSSIIIKNMRPEADTLNLRGMRVLITGGSSGIGFDVAQQILEADASSIVLVARNQTRLQKCKDKLMAARAHENQQIHCLPLDLSTDPEVVAGKIKEMCEQLNGIDILINCAGYSIPGEFENLKLEAFTKMSNTNYLATAVVTHACVPFMKRQNFGQIVFLSSVGGQLGVYGYSAYAPSKFALRGLAEVLYSELKPYGIGVSLVFPADTQTPGLDEENKQKPKLTHDISGQTQTWTSVEVATVIRRGIENRQFMIGCGSDGYFVNALTAGAAPPNSVVEFWAQCLLMPILRVYILFVQNDFFNMIDNECNKKTK